MSIFLAFLALMPVRSEPPEAAMCPPPEDLQPDSTPEQEPKPE